MNQFHGAEKQRQHDRRGDENGVEDFDILRLRSDGLAFQLTGPFNMVKRGIATPQHCICPDLDRYLGLER